MFHLLALLHENGFSRHCELPELTGSGSGIMPFGGESS